jgi:hypothetical protein
MLWAHVVRLSIWYGRYNSRPVNDAFIHDHPYGDAPLINSVLPITPTNLGSANKKITLPTNKYSGLLFAFLSAVEKFP